MALMTPQAPPATSAGNSKGGTVQKMLEADCMNKPQAMRKPKESQTWCLSRVESRKHRAKAMMGIAV